MKKLFALLFVAGTMSIVACGPSAEDQKKIEEAAKKSMDSIFNNASSGMEEAVKEAAATVDTTAKAAEGAVEGAATETK